MKNRSEPPDSRIETRNIEIYGDAVETGQGRIKNLIGFQAAGNEASVEKGGTPEIEEEIQRAGRCTNAGNRSFDNRNFVTRRFVYSKALSKRDA